MLHILLIMSTNMKKILASHSCFSINTSGCVFWMFAFIDWLMHVHVMKKMCINAATSLFQWTHSILRMLDLNATKLLEFHLFLLDFCYLLFTWRIVLSWIHCIHVSVHKIYACIKQCPVVILCHWAKIRLNSYCLFIVRNNNERLWYLENQFTPMCYLYIRLNHDNFMKCLRYSLFSEIQAVIKWTPCWCLLCFSSTLYAGFKSIRLCYDHYTTPHLS